MEIKIYNKTNLCFVFKQGEEKSIITIMERLISARDTDVPMKLSASTIVDSSMLSDLSELNKIVGNIFAKYNPKIEELESKLMSTKAADYGEEYSKDIYSLKKRIQTVAKRLSEADLENEDESFKNRLHELGELKKQLGSFKNDWVDIARKTNGRIKHDIAEIKRVMYWELMYLDLEVMEKLIGGDNL